MWTPRRVVLLLLGLAGCVGTYLLYSTFLGGVDGLPQLPEKFLLRGEDQDIELPGPGDSPTYVRLRQAFGPNSLEVLDTVAYKTRLEMRDRGLVFACGQMEFANPPQPFVTVSPFSVAFFGKPKQPHELQPGEAQEISTFHADKAVLQFDRPVGGPQDISGKQQARLVGMELVSVPEMPSHDARRGQIWMTNNQKSGDDGQKLVFRTRGPLYYRAQDPDAPPSPDAPQVWTTAAVEVVDRRNLPRPLRSANTATAVTKADEFRGHNAVADILLGATLPPPTMTAEGMKVYLEPQDAKTPAGKRNSSGYSGVRLIELTQNVQVNLWTEGGGGFPGAAPPPGSPKPAAADPPAALAAVGGAACDGAAIARRFDEKALLVIQTLGPFRYDFPASRARFEAAPVADPAAPNHVTVTRLSAKGFQDNLVCQLLLIDFDGSDQKAGGPPPKSAAAAPKPHDGGGMKIKALTATGPHVLISVESEQLQAQGTELHYAADAQGLRSNTTLRGAPVYAVRDRNRLQAGGPAAPAEVFIASVSPPPGSKDRKQTRVEVRGPGSITMYDPASADNTLAATWGRSLTHEKEKVGNVEEDLLKFEGGGTFEDRKGGMTLSADRLWLWLAPADAKEGKKAAKADPAGDPSKALPARLLAVGKVESRSAELVIHKTDQLNLWFRDVPPPAPPAPPPAPAVAKADPKAPAPPAGTKAAEPPLAAKTPQVEKKAEPEERPKQPVYLSARVVEGWVVRYPQKAEPPKPDPGVAKADPKPAGKGEATTLRYELEKARCEDRVVVHQDPTDPLKNPRGLDVAGVKLNLDHSPAGSVMTVVGPPGENAQVHFESMSLFGPAVVIDQPNNAVAVDGVGHLVMPAQADLSGGSPSQPTEMVVKWTNSMRFFGAKASAEFLGQVEAVQRPARDAARKVELAPAPRARLSAYRPDPAVAVRPAPPPDDGTVGQSWVLCHRLDVTFDRPIYFNNYRRTGPRPAPKDGQAVAADENPKLKTALCTPMPDDEAAKLPADNAKIARRVFYLETVTGKSGKVLKAQRIEALQLDVQNDEREQQVIATGPGEVRILQLGAKDIAAQPQPRPAKPPGKEPPPAEQEMKLTLVRFPSRMVGRDKNKLYQEAVFDDGGRVWQVPTENLNLQVIDHAPPERAVYLECSQTLKVSSAKPKKDAPAEQWMLAQGNAMFRDEKYQGNAHTITDDGRVTTLTGTDKRLAQLYQLRVNPNERQYTNAQQIKYYRDGRIEVSGSGSGAIRSGP